MAKQPSYYTSLDWKVCMQYYFASDSSLELDNLSITLSL